jgi:dTDP-4-dehydrorhamnose 3,5-epimerase
MIFEETPLPGAFVIELEKREDDRGFFARAFCENEFKKQGLVSGFVQINDSLSVRRGTLRGLHYQLPPRSETKLVRCVRGALYDVVLDLREDSPTFGRSFGIELSAQNRRMLYVPKQFAHGFLTTADDTEAFYLVDAFYSPEHERGIRYDDPGFMIEWPFRPLVVSEKDARHPDFDKRWHLSMGGAGAR